MWGSRRTQQEPRTDGDAAALEALNTATMVAFGGFGFANVKGPATLAYEHLAEAGGRVRPGLEELLRTATPAGKVYAAHLLSRLDHAYGRSVWEWLAAQPDEFATGSGCLMMRSTLAEYAGEQLERESPPA